jgi:hypothetical protein
MLKQLLLLLAYMLMLILLLPCFKVDAFIHHAVIAAYSACLLLPEHFASSSEGKPNEEVCAFYFYYNRQILVLEHTLPLRA